MARDNKNTHKIFNNFELKVLIYGMSIIEVILLQLIHLVLRVDVVQLHVPQIVHVDVME